MDGLQYQHILQTLLVPSVRMLYPEGLIHLQDQSSIHDSFVVQEWLPRQAKVELLDWPTRAPDMNPIENMWSEVKNQCIKIGLSSLPEIAMSYGILCPARGMKLLHLRVTFDQ